MRTIELKNGSVSVHFGWAATRDFAKAANRTLKQLETIEKDMNPGDMLALIWAGMKQGARKNGDVFNLTIDDVADLLDENQNLLVESMEEYSESQSVPDERPNAQAGAAHRKPKSRKPKN